MATDTSTAAAAGRGTAGSGFVLMMLACGQFLMTLDSSVMNVSISQVAADVGTTVTGIQTAITLYTLVMASLMIIGGKIGAMIGRRRAMSIGLMIYAAGTLTTAAAHNLTVLLIGWSLLEGIGAALIMPAIVALVASNFPPAKRTSAYGLIAAAGAIAVAAGPLIGGAVTTFATWRWVFVGEAVLVAGILLGMRRIHDAPVAGRVRWDFVGVVLSIAGLFTFVYGVLKIGSWGLVQPRPGGPVLFGVSPVVWLILGGLLVIWLFLLWEVRVERRGGDPLVRTGLLRNHQLVGGLWMFCFQYFIQAGVFFTVPLFLSVVLQLSALQTGVRLLPLSVALLVAAIGIPRFAPRARPRLVVRLGLLSMAVGTAVFIGGLDPDANAAIVAVPMLFLGLGIGALASQLGAVTVSSVPDEDSSEVGGLQNTMTNIGASLGTALVGAVLIAALTASVHQGVQASTIVPDSVKSQASTQLAAGVPFLSDTDLTAALEKAGLPPDQVNEIVQINSDARLLALRQSLLVIVVFAMIALFCAGMIPTKPVAAPDHPNEPVAPRPSIA